MQEKSSRIQKLNDQLRTTFSKSYGKIMTTSGIMALPLVDQAEIYKLVKSFNQFTADNDPYSEHDFGAVEHKGNKVFWKIDYYSPDLKQGSEDPSDPKKTTRVITIMLANEY